MKIENLSAQATIDGQPCFILIPSEYSRLIIDYIAHYSIGCKLQVVKIPDTLRMMTLEDIKNART